MAQKGAKIMAIFALIGILVSVVGTGILYYIESNKQTQITAEELQKKIDSGEIQMKKEETPTLTEETKTEKKEETNEEKNKEQEENPKAKEDSVKSEDNTDKE